MEPKWIPDTTYIFYDGKTIVFVAEATCEECGLHSTQIVPKVENNVSYKYCPRCGAKMTI